MAKVTYRLSLLYKSTRQPVRGFEAIAHAWGTGGGVQNGQVLFDWHSLHDGTDSPLSIELDQVPAGQNGIVKLTLRGPIDGDPNGDVNYETYVVLRRRSSSDVTLLFEDCPKLAPLTSVTGTALAPALDAEEAADFESLFDAKESVEAGDKSKVNQLSVLSTKLGVSLNAVMNDWYGESELMCHTVYARIEDVGKPLLPDRTVQLHYLGAPSPVTEPQLLGRDIRDPTILYARSRTGFVRLIIRDAASSSVIQELWVHVSRSRTQDVVLVPRALLRK